MCWWQDEQLKISSSPADWITVGGKVGKVGKIDDYTVKFVFQSPNGVLLENLARNACYSPRHHLRQYHPDLGGEKIIQAAMAARKLTTICAQAGEISFIFCEIELRFHNRRSETKN